MFTRPPELTDEAVAATVGLAWSDRTGSIRRIEYAAVGFGSYHWHASGDKPWFVTVDDLVAGRSQFSDSPTDVARRLAAALGSARAVRDAGLAFVIAPVPTIDGEVMRVVGGRWAVHVYPFIEGRNHEWGVFETAVERRAVVELLATLHRRSGPAIDIARRDDFIIPLRRELHGVLVDRAAAWTAGPYGEPARQLLNRDVGLFENRFARYDRLAAGAAASPERMVLTHGEPHAANTIKTSDGLVLIDWDTALIAPPERDLWWFAGDDSACLEQYRDATGVQPRREVVELYRLRWDLTEVSLFVAMFRAPHGDTADTRVAWEGLRQSLEALSLTLRHLGGHSLGFGTVTTQKPSRDHGHPDLVRHAVSVRSTRPAHYVQLVAKRTELQQFMRDVPLFAGLLPSELDRVALVMNPADVAAGDVICSEGEVGRDFYLLADGEATVERGGETVAKLSKGAHFGELAVLDRGPRSATVRAISDCRVYVLHDESFAAVLNEVPALAQKLLAALARRLREAERAEGGHALN